MKKEKIKEILEWIATILTIVSLLKELFFWGLELRLLSLKILYLFQSDMSKTLFIASLICIYFGYRSKNIYQKWASVIIAVLLLILQFKK